MLKRRKTIAAIYENDIEGLLHLYNILYSTALQRLVDQRHLFILCKLFLLTYIEFLDNIFAVILIILNTIQHP